jgi:hypothetical protein
VDQADKNLIAILQNALPDKLIILLPFSGNPEVTMFYSDLQAVLVQSSGTSNIVDWGDSA